jgi:O-antigen ligase
MIVLQVALTDRERFASPFATNLGMGAALLTIVFAGSRSAFLGLAVALPVILLMDRRRLAPVLRGALTASVLGMAILFGPPLIGQGLSALEGTGVSMDADDGFFMRLPYLINKEMAQKNAVQERIASAFKALEMWRGAPIIGEGLGSYRHAIEGQSDIADTIHNSFLWLLAETGLVGALLFLAFFGIVLYSLYRASRVPNADPLIAGVFGVLLVFAGASIGTEIMYQRYFWFLMGLAICLPPIIDPNQRPGNATGR